MIKDIKRLMNIKDENDNFILEASYVAEKLHKHRETVYASRKKDCKLDKLVIFDIVKDMLEHTTKSEHAFNSSLKLDL